MVNPAQQTVDRATLAIRKATTVEESAKALIATLRQVIADNNIDAQPLMDVLDAFDASSGALGDALVENTPSA